MTEILYGGRWMILNSLPILWCQQPQRDGVHGVLLSSAVPNDKTFNHRYPSRHFIISYVQLCPRLQEEILSKPTFVT